MFGCADESIVDRDRVVTTTRESKTRREQEVRGGVGFVLAQERDRGIDATGGEHGTNGGQMLGNVELDRWLAANSTPEKADAAIDLTAQQLRFEKGRLERTGTVEGVACSVQSAEHDETAPAHVVSESACGFARDPSIRTRERLRIAFREQQYPRVLRRR